MSQTGRLTARLNPPTFSALSLACVELCLNPALWFGDDGSIVFANSAAFDLLGYTPDELTMVSAADLGLAALLPDRLAGEDNSLPASPQDLLCRAKGNRVLPVTVACRQVATDSGDFILASMQLLSLPAPEPFRAVAGAETELAKLRHLKRQYLSLSENSADVIFRTDRAGRFVYVNRAIRSFTEFFPVDLLGKRHGEAGFEAGYCALVEEHLEWVFQHNAPCEEEVTLCSARGEFIMNLRLFPEHDETLKVATVLGVMRDITLHRKAEQNYAALFAQMIDGFALHEIVCDDRETPVDYRFLSVNPAFERLTGIPAGDVIGRTVLDVMPRTERYWIEAYGRVALTGEELTYENFSRELGRYFEVKAYRPAPGQFACVFVDITDRKLAEAAHRQAEAKFRSAFYDAGFGMVIVALDGCLLEVNSVYCQLLGYARDELVGLSFTEFTHPDDLPQQLEKIALLLAGEVHNYQLEKRYRHRDGHVFWIALSISLVRDESGQPQFFIGQIQDIDERKCAEHALRESEERFRLLLNSAAEAIYGLDIRGECIFCNTSCVELLGYRDESELRGRNMHDLIHHTRGDGSPYPAAECMIYRAFQGKENVHHEGEMLWRADGSSFEAELWAYPVIKKDRVVGAVVTFLDITERKSLQAQAFRSSQLAALGELAAGVAHEINNPINGVINYAQYLINRRSGDAPEVDVLQKIIKEGGRIAAIVRNLLAIAHEGAEEKGYHEPAEIVREVMSVVRSQLSKDGIIVQFELEEGLPPIFCSKQKIEQVILNLISNSRHALNEKFADAHPDKLIRISARLTSANGQHYVRLVVFDQGAGIPEGLLGRVLNPFVTTKPAGVGTGLGLSICHDLVSKQKGRFDIDSRFGKWTRVVVELPIAE